MNRVLTICPTIKRPEIASRMFKSFYETQTTSDIVFNLNEKITITEVFNFYSSNLSYPFYHMTNDDFVYKTPGWDRIFIDTIASKGECGICYGNDNCAREGMCTAPFISSNIIKITGWLQLPTLQHLCGDVVWYYIGKKLNILHYCPEVIIEHKHFINNSTDKDEVYEKTNSKYMYEKDNMEFRRWLREDADIVISKLTKAIHRP